MATDKPRIALYSPGMVGLGHMRRNLLLVRLRRVVSERLVSDDHRSSGGRDIRLPGQCRLPQSSGPSEGSGWPLLRPTFRIEVPELVRLRTDVISAALNHFAPDVLVVDHLPGALSELGPFSGNAGKKARRGLYLACGTFLRSRIPFTLQWARLGHEETIQRFYEAIWIYGDPTIFDMRAEYKLPSVVAEKARFTGYLNQYPPMGVERKTRTI